MTKLKHETFEINEKGEVITTSKSYSIKTSSEAFYMIFIDHMAWFFKISCITDIRILAKMCSMAEFNTGKVRITSQDRKEILDSLIGITTQNFSHSLNRLKKGGLITGDKGSYEINPKIFWKGTTDQRNKLLKEQGLEINIKFKLDEE